MTPLTIQIGGSASSIVTSPRSTTTTTNANVLSHGGLSHGYQNVNNNHNLNMGGMMNTSAAPPLSLSSAMAMQNLPINNNNNNNVNINNINMSAIINSANNSNNNVGSGSASPNAVTATNHSQPQHHMHHHSSSSASTTSVQLPPHINVNAPTGNYANLQGGAPGSPLQSPSLPPLPLSSLTTSLSNARMQRTISNQLRTPISIGHGGHHYSNSSGGNSGGSGGNGNIVAGSGNGPSTSLGSPSMFMRSPSSATHNLSNSFAAEARAMGPQVLGGLTLVSSVSNLGGSGVTGGGGSGAGTGGPLQSPSTGLTTTLLGHTAFPSSSATVAPLLQSSNSMGVATPATTINMNMNALMTPNGLTTNGAGITQATLDELKSMAASGFTVEQGGQTLADLAFDDDRDSRSSGTPVKPRPLVGVSAAPSIAGIPPPSRQPSRLIQPATMSTRGGSGGPHHSNHNSNANNNNNNTGGTNTPRGDVFDPAAAVAIAIGANELALSEAAGPPALGLVKEEDFKSLNDTAQRFNANLRLFKWLLIVGGLHQRYITILLTSYDSYSFHC
jgi:hypothetical protein